MKIAMIEISTTTVPTSVGLATSDVGVCRLFMGRAANRGGGSHRCRRAPARVARAAEAECRARYADANRGQGPWAPAPGFVVWGLWSVASGLPPDAGAQAASARSPSRVHPGC